MDNIRVRDESLYDWRSTLTEETDCDCEGCGQDPCVKCGESHHNINEEIQGGVSVENYADGVQFNEIETVDIIKPKALDPSNWRSELTQVNERYKFIGPGKGKKTSEKDMSKNKGEKIGVDYSRIRASKSVDKETVSASNEIEGDLVDEGLLKGALSGAKLIAKYALKGGKGLARKGVGDVSKFVKSQKVANRAINIEKIRATKLLEPIKPAKIKWNSTVPPKSKPSVTTSTTKALPGFAKIDPPKIKFNATVPPKPKPRVTTITSKKITGSAGTQYKDPIGANPTAKTQYKEPVTPKYSRSQKSALTGKANKIIDQVRGKTPGAKVSARMTKAIDSSTKKGTYSDKVNQLLKVPDPKVKSPISTPTPTKKSTPTPKKDEGGKAIQRVLGGAGGAAGYKLATGGKEKKESFSNWRSEINL